jgi:putative two-component system response regulator
VYGRDIVRNAERNLGGDSFLGLAREIIYTHHERWDGTGYPEGLKGNDIPLSGRMMALADVYDALISKRVYKPPFSHEKAVGIITQGKGSHFDPLMVDIFLLNREQFRQIALEHADFDEERHLWNRSSGGDWS